jgi:hypothetical protein
LFDHLKPIFDDFTNIKLTVIKDWLQVIRQNILAKVLTLNTILFAHDQVILASIEDEMQRTAYTLNNVATKYNLKISVNKTKATAMKGKTNVRNKIVANNNILKKKVKLSLYQAIEAHRVMRR